MPEGSLRILIADDSRPLRAVAAHLLSKLGACQEAGDGREAVTLFQNAYQAGEPFHLVVLDILMPRLNGVDALRQMRQLEDVLRVEVERRAKVLMLTSLDDPRFVLESQLDAGADFYLAKPLDAAELRQALIGLDLIPGPDEAAEPGDA